MARVVKEGVSDAINNRLSDPRIEGIISVTRVEMQPDLRGADVYLSIMIPNDKKQKSVFEAIDHAKICIQKHVVKKITAKFTPRLCFKLDSQFKKSLDIMNLIDEVAKDFKDEPLEDGFDNTEME